MSSDSTSATKSYVHMGHGRAPKNVTRLLVHKSVTVIREFAFQQCHDLKEVILPEGLIKIETSAFYGCGSLGVIHFPSTLRFIGAYTFRDCSSLVRVNLNKGLQTIGARAFEGCQSILHLKVPSTVTTIGSGAFASCHALKGVQLCEGLLTIGEEAFSGCYSLLGINIPSSVTTIEDAAFDDCNLLRNVVITSDSTLGWEELDESCLLHNLCQKGCLLDLVKGRFDDLLLHRICFYQTKSAALLEKVKEHSTKEMFTQVDCLGMTHLHIFACSESHDVGLYEFFVDKNPEALQIKDKWGETPMSYAILSESPQEIIQFLFEKHSKFLNGSLPYFKVIVESIVTKDGTSAEFVQKIIQNQRFYFPNLEIDWQRIVDENVEGNMHVKMFGVLTEASVFKRSNCMSLEHRLAINNFIIKVGKESLERDRESRNQVRDLIVASLQQFTEATTMIELALWQVTIDEMEHDQGSNKERNHYTKRARIDDTEIRKNCHFKCQAKDIIPSILPFL